MGAGDIERAAMNTSEKIDQLAAALAKAQADMPAITKGKTAKVPTKSGGSYSYSYADLADIIDTVRGTLAANGFAVMQGPCFVDGKPALCTRLIHVSGQWVESDYPLSFNGSPQERGSELTYSRRYALCGMLGVAAEDDDDGAGAGRQQPPRRVEQKPAGDKLSDKEDFRRALHAAFKGREFDTAAEKRAVEAVLTGYGVQKLEQLDLGKRHAVINHVLEGGADKYRNGAAA